MENDSVYDDETAEKAKFYAVLVSITTSILGLDVAFVLFKELHVACRLHGQEL